MERTTAVYLEYGGIRYEHLVYLCGDGNVCSGLLDTMRSHFLYLYVAVPWGERPETVLI